MQNDNVKNFNKTLNKDLKEPISRHINFAVSNEEIKLFPMFSIYDKRLGKYIPPFMCSSKEEGIRQFENLINYTNSLMCKFPEDYTLVHIGDFDDVVGRVILPGEKTLPPVEGISVKKPDSLQYDALLKEVKGYLSQVGAAVEDYEKSKIRLSSEAQKFVDLFDTFNLKSRETLDAIEKKSVELFEIPKITSPEKPENKFKNIISSLFGSY